MSEPLRTVAADCWGASRAILYVCERMSFGLAGDAGQVDAQPAKVPLLAQGGQAGVCGCVCVCTCMHVVITFSPCVCEETG